MNRSMGFTILLCTAILCAFIGVFTGIDRAVAAFAEHAPLERNYCVVIDAGHGGVDGGAVSCTGVYESHINLEIALRLEDLMHLIGIDTKMIRTTDISVYTSGESIAAKKASDLKERVRIVNAIENAVLISIHQNHYSNQRYSGAQMFYAPADGSKELAVQLQNAFVKHLDPHNKRKAKKTEGLYLMEHVEKPSVLVECGFLSNPAEENKLRNEEYQKKICCVIASVCSTCFANGLQHDLTE